MTTKKEGRPTTAGGGGGLNDAFGARSTAIITQNAGKVNERETALLRAALSYAARGWAVFPLRRRGKEPLTEHGFKDATTAPQTIAGWWRRWPDANIGVATGTPSGLLVIDIDPRHGGNDSLHELERQHGSLPETIESLTGGGGHHIFFRSPDGQGCGRLAEGIDIKANGGYIVAPPSIHPSGRPYAWEVAHHPDDVDLADPPAWLLALLNAPKRAAAPAPAAGRIPQGQRNSTLTSLAGSMRRKGMSQAAIEAALLQENAARCDPPLDGGEVRKIAASVSRYDPATDDPGLSRDYGHAAVLATLFRDRYRWATHRGTWMQYAAGVWRPVPEESVAKAAADTLRQHYAAQIAATTDKSTLQELAKKVAETCTYARITGALAFLKGWDGILTLADEWDKDPWLLNVRNGTLDLRACTLKPHDPGDLLTKQAPVEYDPNAKGEKWQQHLEMFLPAPDVRRQVQRDLGGALTGAVLDECLPIWWGTGGNGKTTTLMTILRILGDYGCRAAPDLLVQSKYDRHPTEVADLCGKRLVFSVEMDKAKQLAEALVKDLTGGDRKKGRFMRQDFFEFDQTFSIILVCNQKPIVTGTDNGLWRRLRLVPWTQQVDPQARREQEAVIADLLTESPAILNWLLDGLRDRQREPFWVADEVRAVTDAYRVEMDLLADFLEECCILKPRATVPKAELYAAYEAWCERNHEHPVSKKTFTRMLKERGVGEGREGHQWARVYVGIGLLANRDLPTHADGFSSNSRENENAIEFTENVSASVGIDAPKRP